MNKKEFQEIILENQQALMNSVNWILVNKCPEGSGDIQRQLIKSYENTREALAPANTEFDYAGTLTDNTPKTSEVKKE